MHRLRLFAAALAIVASLAYGFITGAPRAVAAGSCVYYPSGQRTLGVCYSTGRVHRVWTRCGAVTLYSPFFNDEEWTYSPSCGNWQTVTGRGITWP